MKTQLPDFTPEGVLPPNDYPLTINELRDSMLVHGRSGVTSETWDVKWRRLLVDNLSVLANQLWEVGIDSLFIDGSFVENKAHPGDIDGYFECAFSQKVSGDLERELNLLDPHRVWTWAWKDRQMLKGKPRLPMWVHYRVELYPHLTDYPLPQGTGIMDSFGHELEFPSAFRQSRSFTQKGVIKIIQD